MNLRWLGLRAACFSGIACFGFLLVSGCGTVTPNSSGGSSGSTTAATPAVSTGPQLGLLWDTADSTLRPLSGIPGSTQLGAPLFPPGTWLTGAFSGSTQSALLIDPAGNLQLLALPSLQPQTIASHLSAASSIVFSPRGAWAAVFAPGSASVLVVSGLPQGVSANSVNVGATLRGAAISDAGTLLLAADSSGAIAVTSITVDGTRSSVATLQGFGGMAFLPGSENFLLADSVANTLALWRSGAASIVATQTNGLNQPFAVAVSQDSRWAVAADRADSSLLRVDLTGATPPVPSTCACSPSQLTALNGNAVFELTPPGANPGWMIEADDLSPRVLFIPPARSGQ